MGETVGHTIILTMKFFVLFLLCTLCVIATAFHDLPERARGGKAYQKFLSMSEKSLKSSEPLIFNSRVDNFDSSNNATFAQRYYVDNQFWTGTGPVFYYISGEGTCNGPPTGYVASLGKQYSALLISLEHRFYGESIPNGNALSENYKYLSVEQALADLSNFTNFYKGEVPATQTVPWVVFGGSYSGGLSSWYRATYPEQSVAALSSSGVVNCIVNFYQFDMQVSAASGNDCGNKIKAVQAAFKRAIGSPATEAGLQRVLPKFYCEKDMAAADFYYMIADSWSMAVQYGGKTAQCAALSAITADSSDEEIMDTFAAFSNDYWGKDFCSGGFYNTKALSDPARWDVNSRSWRYQTCSQVSYFNTAPASGSLRDAGVDLQYHLQQCAAIFGGPMFPSSAQFNQKYGADFPAADKVFYSNFGDDPWQRASVWFAPSESQPYHLAECDDCGHCMDLHAPSESDPAELVESRQEFERYLAQWLPAPAAASKHQ